jgi:hypothetical protein
MEASMELILIVVVVVLPFGGGGYWGRGRGYWWMIQASSRSGGEDVAWVIGCAEALSASTESSEVNPRYAPVGSTLLIRLCSSISIPSQAMM